MLEILARNVIVEGRKCNNVIRMISRGQNLELGFCVSFTFTLFCF